MRRAARKPAKPANAPKRRLYRRGWASDSPTTCVRVSRLATAWSLSSDRTWSRRPAARSSGSVSSNGENHVSACPGNALGVRHENFRYARVLCAVNDDVSGYADHGKIHRIHADSLTDGVVAGKEAAGERFADHGDFGAILIVVVVKGTPGDGNRHRAEVPRRHLEEGDDWNRFSSFRFGTAGDF